LPKVAFDRPAFRIVFKNSLITQFLCLYLKNNANARSSSVDRFSNKTIPPHLECRSMPLRSDTLDTFPLPRSRGGYRKHRCNGQILWRIDEFLVDTGCGWFSVLPKRVSPEKFFIAAKNNSSFVSSSQRRHV
jgi:hypothetical protein